MWAPGWGCVIRLTLCFPLAQVAPQAQIPNDPVFSVLYKELYYRHIYAKLQPNVEQRFGSWSNYCEFFDMVLSCVAGPFGR